jgi:hypothetical protein
MWLGVALLAMCAVGAALGAPLLPCLVGGACAGLLIAEDVKT